MLTRLRAHLRSLFTTDHPDPSHTPGKTRLGVQPLEDRLTPSTWAVQIPDDGPDNGLFPNQVVVLPNGNNFVVTHRDRIIAQRSMSGVSHINLIGTDQPETFIVHGRGIPISVQDSANDQIFLLGTDPGSGSQTGADTIVVSDRWAWLNGRSVYYRGLGNVVVAAQGGEDTITVASGSTPLTVDAGAGDDTLIVQDTGRDVTRVVGLSGVPAAVQLTGNAGRDTFVIGAAAPDNASGAAYNDAFSLDTLSGGVLIFADFDDAGLYIYDKGDTSSNIYTVQPGSGFGTNDIIRGNARIMTHRLRDLTIHAGSGHDTVNASRSSVRVNAFGYDGNDVLVGGSREDVLNGGNGRDILIGGNGADTLYGGEGQDILIGGSHTFMSTNLGLGLLRLQWTGSAGYESRVELMQDHMGSAVTDDTAADRMYGGGDLDWFWGTWVGYPRTKFTANLTNEVLDRGLGTISIDLSGYGRIWLYGAPEGEVVGTR